MHDPARVRIRECARDIPEDRHDLGDCDRSIGKALSQRTPLDERHRVIRQASHLARRQNGDDVGLLQSRGELDLPREPLSAEPLGQLWREYFDHDSPSQRAFLGEKHARHAAAAELPLYGVGSAERIVQLRFER